MTTTTDGMSDERFTAVVMRLADLPWALQLRLAGEIRDALAKCERADCPKEEQTWTWLSAS